MNTNRQTNVKQSMPPNALRQSANIPKQNNSQMVKRTPVTPTVSKAYDIHELMKAQMLSDTSDESSYQFANNYEKKTTIVDVPTAQTTNAKPMEVAVVNQDIGFEDYYVYCDSVNKEPTSLMSEGLIIFDIRKKNNNQPLTDILEIEILPFFIGNVQTDPTYQPDYFYFRRVHMLLENIGTQQYVNSGGNFRFHFEFETESTGSALRLHPILGKYIFHNPIQTLDLINVRFVAPINKRIAFNNDTFAVSPSGAGLVPPADTRISTAPIEHNLTIGAQYTVYFSDYNSTNNSINETINNINGHVVDVIDQYTLQLTSTPGISGTGNFSVVLDPSTGLLPIFKMVVAERRMAFTMRIRTVKNKKTNGIVAV